MGYLDNASITVDAVLTKKGREILKNGGNLNITSFTMSDTGVDYTLWNPDHPSGSAFYGEAIEDLPMLEASVHAEYNLRNRLNQLFTLYNDLFYDIPKTGIQSHTTLFKQSRDYIGNYVDSKDAEIEELSKKVIEKVTNATGGILRT